ncbi:MAG: 6-phosphofructokinase [bacterium]
MVAKRLKGRLVVGQSGGPTAVINASLVGVFQEALKHDEITGIYGALHGIEGVLREEFVDLKREKPETIQGLMKTPSAALGSCRHKLKEEDYARILEVFKAHNVRYFHYIGGNDSQDTSKRISDLARQENYELRVIGIPKTIDNDLAITDHCPGYGSVARFVATAVRDAGKDTEAIGVVDKVKVVEIMGRNAGWITAAAALAKKDPDDAPHLIYVPERPINMDKLLDDVQRVFDEYQRVVIAVCEGVRSEDGQPLVASGKAIDVDSFGHKQMGGVSDFLCRQIADNLKLKARYDKPGTIQRMSIALASKTDIRESYLVGQMAVKLATKGETDYMVTLVRVSNDPYKCTTGVAKLEDVANAEKLMPDSFINKEGNYVTKKFINYVEPLIGGPLPEYFKLKKYRVKKLLPPYGG